MNIYKESNTVPRGLALLQTISLILLSSACTQSLSYSEMVDGPDGAVLALSPSEAQLVCSESLVFEIEGGVPPYSLSLQNALDGAGEKLEDDRYTAPADKTGTVLIRAEDSYGGSATAEIVVVSQAGSLPLTLSPSSISLYKGKDVSFEATGGTGEYSFTLAQAIGGAGESLAGSTYTAPTDTGGTAVVRVTDGLGDTAEATVSVSFTTPTVPDVNYGSLSINSSGSTEGGGDFSGSFSFSNNGGDDGSRTITWIVYYSTDTSIGSGDTIVSQGDLAALGAGNGSGSIPFSGTWPYPSSDTTYYLIASVSAEDDVDGSDNSINTAVALEAVVEKDIDYIIADESISYPSNVGDEVREGFNIYNTGTVDGGETLNWGLYYSADEDWDGDDVLITGGSRAALNKGTSVWISFGAPLWSYPTGTYYLIIRVMADDEINQTNNFASHGPFAVN